MRQQYEYKSLVTPGLVLEMLYIDTNEWLPWQEFSYTGQTVTCIIAHHTHMKHI